MSKAAKRRAIADKIAADIPKLRKEIADRRRHLAQAKTRALAPNLRLCEKLKLDLNQNRGWIVVAPSWFAAWSRYAPAIAKAEGALARALQRLPAAIAKAEDAETADREEAAKRAAIRARNVGLMRRLDALREDAPSIQKRWAAERRAEEKRLKKLKAKLEQRTHKDRSQLPDFMTKPVATLPPPIEQPDLTTPDPAEVAPPPREGLIPGQYRYVDPDRLGLNLLDADPLPPSWTPRHVGKRLIEAHDVLRRLPMNVRPQGYSALWPEYTHDFGELVVQAGAQTIAMGRNSVLKVASADEVARMNEALEWIVRFVTRMNAWAAGYLNSWASDRDATPDDDGAPHDLLKFIADALNEANEVVR
ncbi:hypothetical protein [Bradyrhizobium sp. USDA 4350]